MSGPASILDSAFDQVSALDFKIPNPFVNHGPMACEALAALGLDDLIDDWVRGFGEGMVKAPQPIASRWRPGFDWMDALGDYRLLPEWMGFFQRAIADHGWQSVVEIWVPRLMPGLVAALFHGVIRTSHAVRAVECADTPARRAELARALGNWAVWFAIGQPADRSEDVEDAGKAAADAAAKGAGAYALEPTIFHLHGVTGAMAVQLLIGHLAASDAAAAVTQLRVEHAALYAGIEPAAPAEHSLVWNDDVVAAASQSHDPHQIKLVEACRRGSLLTGAPAFVAAAQTVTRVLSR